MQYWANLNDILSDIFYYLNVGGGEIIKEETYIAKKNPNNSPDQQAIKHGIAALKDSHVSFYNSIAIYNESDYQRYCTSNRK